MTAAALIIVNWNGGELLERCLRRVFAQTRRPDRVLVVDNASTDGSLQEAQAQFPSAEFVCNRINAGFARGNNLAVACCADCEWICLLNPDAFPDAQWLAKLLRAAADNPGYDCFASLILKDGRNETIDSAGDTYRKRGIALHRFHNRILAETAADVRVPSPVFSACAAAAMYRRSVFMEAGGFDESYFAFYEDVDLGFRFLLSGYKTLFVPDAVVYHRGGGTTGGEDSDAGAYYGQRNFILTYFKNMPSPILWRAMPAHLWAIVRGLARGFAHGRGLLLLKATFGAILQLPRCLHERMRIQSSRRISAKELELALSD